LRPYGVCGAGKAKNRASTGQWSDWKRFLTCFSHQS
jgi:hypothetical protein